MTVERAKQLFFSSLVRIRKASKCELKRCCCFLVEKNIPINRNRTASPHRTSLFDRLFATKCGCNFSALLKPSSYSLSLSFLLRKTQYWLIVVALIGLKRINKRLHIKREQIKRNRNRISLFILFNRVTFFIENRYNRFKAIFKLSLQTK